MDIALQVRAPSIERSVHALSCQAIRQRSQCPSERETAAFRACCIDHVEAVDTSNGDCVEAWVMSTYVRLMHETEASRDVLLDTTIMQREWHGHVVCAKYLVFLYQSYHHFRQAVAAPALADQHLADIGRRREFQALIQTIKPAR